MKIVLIGGPLHGCGVVADVAETTDNWVTHDFSRFINYRRTDRTMPTTLGERRVFEWVDGAALLRKIMNTPDAETQPTG